MDKESKRIIDFISQQLNSKLTELETSSRQRDKELAELKESLSQVQRALPAARPVARSPLSSLSLKLEKFLTQEVKKVGPKLYVGQGDGPNVQALMSPTNDVKKLKTKTPSFGNLTPPPTIAFEEPLPRPVTTDSKPQKKIRSKSQPRGSRSPRSFSPIPIKNFDQAMRETAEIPPNEHFARLGENLLLIAEYTGPVFLCLSKRLTSLCIDLKLDLMDLLREQIAESALGSGRRSVQFGQEVVSSLEIFEARKGKYLAQQKVTSAEIHILRLLMCLLGKGGLSTNEQTFWKQCQRFLEQKHLTNLSDYDFSPQVSLEASKFMSLNKLQPLKEYPLLFRPLAKAVLEITQHLLTLPAEDNYRLTEIEKETRSLLRIRALLSDHRRP